MKTKNDQGVRIRLDNGFTLHSSTQGTLLVGKILHGKISENAFLIVGNQEIKMENIITRVNPEVAPELEFEVSKEISPSILWWKLYGKVLSVKNIPFNV